MNRATCAFNLWAAAILFMLGSFFPVQPVNAQTILFYLPSASDTSKATHTVSGTVINLDTGEPVSRALVHFIQIGDRLPGGTGAIAFAPNVQRAMLTDRDGHFKFKGVPQADVFISATKPGFLNDKGELFSVPGQRVRVGLDATSVVIRLMPTAVITGRVTDTDGEPVEGIEITIFRLRVENGRKHLQPVQPEKGQPTLTTNENGEFRAFGLTPGTYYVVVIPLWASDSAFGPEGPGPNGIDVASTVNGSDDPPDAGYPVTYYPGAAELSQSTPIQLSAGQEERIDLTLRRIDVVSIAGTVTGYPRGEDPELQFLNQSGDRIAFFYDFDPETGRFEAKLISTGLCTIRADTDEAAGHPWHAELTLKAEANTKNVHLTLLPAPFIPSVVRAEASKSQSDADRQGIANPQNDTSLVNVVLHPAELERADIAPAKEQEGLNETSLVLRNIDAGIYGVQVIVGRKSLCVKSISYAGTDLLREKLTVTPGSLSSMQIVLRDDCAALEVGTNPDDSAVRFVVVVPDHAPWNPMVDTLYTIKGNEDARLHFSPLTPGVYRIFAFDSIEGLEYTNPDALSEYASRATQVSLEPNESASVKVDVIHRGKQPQRLAPHTSPNNFKTADK